MIISACGIFFKTKFFHVTCVLSQNLIRKTLKENQKNDSCKDVIRGKNCKTRGGPWGKKGFIPYKRHRECLVVIYGRLM